MVFDDNLNNEDIKIDFESIAIEERGQIASLFDRLERLSPSRGRIHFELIKQDDKFLCRLNLNSQNFEFNKTSTHTSALEAAREVMDKAFEALRFWKQNRFDTYES